MRPAPPICCLPPRKWWIRGRPQTLPSAAREDILNWLKSDASADIGQASSDSGANVNSVAESERAGHPSSAAAPDFGDLPDDPLTAVAWLESLAAGQEMSSEDDQ